MDSDAFRGVVLHKITSRIRLALQDLASLQALQTWNSRWNRYDSKRVVLIAIYIVANIYLVAI